MSLPVRLRPEAEEDLLDAASWYEQHRESLGREFLDAVEVVLAAVSENPRRYPVMHRDVRRALLRRFPFGLFFRIAGEEIDVVAIMHASRHPRRWKGRE